MAYARYDRTCPWYVFWESRKGGAADGGSEEERLAIWHKDHRADTPAFSYAAVREMLDRDDLSRVPGYTRGDHGRLRAWMTEFIHDVDADRGA